MIRHCAQLLRAAQADLAVDTLRDVLSEAPDHGRAHALMSLALLQLDRIPAADEEAQRALRLEPLAAVSHRAQAEVALARHDLERAADHLAQALAIAPEDPGVLASQARWGAARGLDDKADALFAQATMLAPGDVPTLTGWAALQLRRGQDADAARLLALALEHNPNHPDALVLLGRVALAQEDVPTAHRQACAALHARPRHRSALSLLAAVKGRQNRAVGWWWRYSLWADDVQAARWPLVLAGVYLGVQLLVLLLLDLERNDLAGVVQNVWVAVIGYSLMGPGWFDKALANELSAGGAKAEDAW